MSSEEKAKKKEKKEKKKEKKQKDKVNKGDKAHDKDDDKRDDNGVVPFKDGKQRKQRKSVTFSDSYPFDPEYKDQCVQDALRLMLDGLEGHIRDLAIYPRVVAYAVSQTVAQMVQILCYSDVKWMHTWEDVDGRAHDEWDRMPELHLPPIDTWARAVIPLKLSSVPMTFMKPIRSEEGQFQVLADPCVFHERKEPVPRVLRRASDTTLVMKVQKCNECILFDKKEFRRRATNPPDATEKQRKKMLEGVRRRLSAYLRDQGILNKILKERGFIQGPRSDSHVEHNKGAFFETYC